MSQLLVWMMWGPQAEGAQTEVKHHFWVCEGCPWGRLVSESQTEVAPPGVGASSSCRKPKQNAAERHRGRRLLFLHSLSCILGHWGRCCSTSRLGLIHSRGTPGPRAHRWHIGASRGVLAAVISRTCVRAHTHTVGYMHCDHRCVHGTCICTPVPGSRARREHIHRGYVYTVDTHARAHVR